AIRVADIVLELVDRSLLLKEEIRSRQAVYRWPRPVRELGLAELMTRSDVARTEESYLALCRRVLGSLQGRQPLTEADYRRVADLTPDLLDVALTMPDPERHDTLRMLSGALENLLEVGGFKMPWLTGQLSMVEPEL